MNAQKNVTRWILPFGNLMFILLVQETTQIIYSINSIGLLCAIIDDSVWLSKSLKFCKVFLIQRSTNLPV